MRLLSPLLLPLLAACSREGVPVESVRGTLTWSVDFDAAAEARGFADCTYSRRYDGLTDRSAPWLCPECDAVFRADVRLQGASCYGTISADEASGTEWIGWSGERFFRSSTLHYRLSEQGNARVDGDRRSIRNPSDGAEIEGGGSFTLDMQGELDVGDGRGDPMWGFGPVDDPACGWDRADPPVYEGDWRLSVGQPLPDGWFVDGCGEPMRLHDQLAGYLVVEVGAVDCGPCQGMAAAEEAFLRRMDEDGVDVRAVTLLAPSLERVIDEMPVSELEEWTRVFGLSMPVVGDRGWGLWLGLDALGEGFGYPTVIVARPDGTVIDVHTGFSTWDPIRAFIKADAAR